MKSGKGEVSRIARLQQERSSNSKHTQVPTENVVSGRPDGVRERIVKSAEASLKNIKAATRGIQNGINE